MIFKDRIQAGKLLAGVLSKYKDSSDTVIFGLPRGGLVPAHVVAQELHVPLDIICARKISAPFNPEFAVGAVTETGEKFMDEDLIARLEISEDYLEQAIKTQTIEASRRQAVYKKNRPSLNPEGKTVILIDDGIATGATMKAAIQSIKAQKAKKIIVAIPVAPPETLKEIEAEADELVCLAAPVFFQAVGQFYQDFSQVEDDEVIALLNDF